MHADRRGHRPHRRDRQVVHLRPRAIARGGAGDRHGAPALRPRRAGLEEDRIPARRHPRPRCGRRAWSTTPTSSSTSPSSSSPGGGESREINLTGSRNVFEAAAAAGAKRLVYTSSVAAYGFHRGMPDADRRGRAGAGHRAPSLLRHKAEVEARAGARRWSTRTPSPTSSAPASSPGREATLLLELIPLLALGPAAARAAALGARQGARRCVRSCPIPACPSSSSTTTTSPPPSAPPCSATASPASTTSPAPVS